MVGRQDVPSIDSPATGLPVPGGWFAGHLVEALVGRGGMGVVFRARHPRLDRVVALKVIVPELLEDATVQQRFLEEAAAAASIEHPNVVPVHDAGESDGVAYMVMRYVHGMDLRAVVRGTGPLDPARAAEVVARVGDALDSLHRVGYVHRDVNPRNVLIASGGHVYLSDFGLARQVSRAAGSTRAGHWVGTVDYVSPEQICGRRADARSDVYALGCLLHFALTGHAPYERDSDGAKLWAHMHEPAPAPSRLRPDLAPSMDAVVARALAKDPADRFGSAGELGRAAMDAARDTRADAPAARPPRCTTTSAPEACTVSSAGAAG